MGVHISDPAAAFNEIDKCVLGLALRAPLCVGTDASFRQGPWGTDPLR